MTSSSAAAEEIWALIKETRKDMKEADARAKKAAEEADARAEEADARAKEADARAARFDARMEEYRIKAEASMEELRALHRETERQVRETAAQLKKSDRRFNSQWGKLVESLVEGSLVNLLKTRGIKVRGTSRNQRVFFLDADGRRKEKEFDIVVVNDTEAVVVEVKTTLNPGKVRYFLSALEDVKRYFHYFSAMRVYGAVAYIRSEAEADVYAQRQGLFAVRATGDSARIVNPPDFRPKAFPSRRAGD